MGTTSVHFKVTEDRRLVKREDFVKVEPQVEELDATSFLSKYGKYATALLGVAVLAVPDIAMAEANMNGGKNIILLLQKASFWVGMGITIWGIVEAQLDFPGWRGRIVKGVVGYIGILLVPLVFIELQNSLQVDVWSTIDKEMSR